MEGRRIKARQRFWLLVLTGVLMLLLAAGWFAYSVLTQSREDELRAALALDPDAFADALREWIL